MPLELTSYHFDLGDSSAGPIGACARVTAKDCEQAVTILRSALELLEREYEVLRKAEGVEYLTVYFNPERITAANIDDEEPHEKGIKEFGERSPEDRRLSLDQQ